jgi:hypothetical protein
MPQLSKDCAICVYNGACEGRKGRADIVDCCIPEAPLRKLQHETQTVERFITVTRKYINAAKQKSRYWRDTLKNTD